MIKETLVTFFFLFLSACGAMAQAYHSVIITEIMADPTPAKGLPDAEYIELFNASNQTISLKGWKLIAGARSVVFPDSAISANSYVIVCHRNSVAALAPFGKVVGLSTFSLTNDGMSLGINNAANQLVHSVSYQNKWWHSDKNDGGYSIEMANVNFPCGDKDNWVTSINESGGTPGSKNSIAEERTDTFTPVWERTDVQSNTELHLFFSKRMDSLNAVSGAIIELSGKQIVKRQLDLPDFRILKLTLDSPLLKDQEYRLTVLNIADCSGNILRETQNIVAIPVLADSGHVVINEILFNPFSGGVDFVELYNRSSKHISLKDWTLGNVKSDGTSTYSLITSRSVSLPPYGYLALATDVGVLRDHYPAESERKFFEMSTFPSFPNADGGVVIRNERVQVLDRVSYSEKMHHSLLTDFKGISIERKDPNKASSDWSNWHSASSTSGYATPGYVNSQVKNDLAEAGFTVKPEAFSPDTDGMDGYASLHYQQNFAGSLATIRIFNIGGRVVKNLVKNQLLGTSGELKWDGTDDRGIVVRTGYYFIVIDVFGVGGYQQQYKCKVVVANRRN
jgi:hypothetical protein